MPVNCNDFFIPFENIDEETKKLLDLDVIQFCEVIDLVLTKPQDYSKTQFSAQSVNIDCYTTLSNFNTPDILRYVHYVDSALNAMYKSAGWSKLNLVLQRSETVDNQTMVPQVNIAIEIFR